MKRLLADSMAPPYNIPFTQTLDDVKTDDLDLAKAEAVDEFAVTQTLPLSNVDDESDRPTSDSGLEAR